MDIVVTEQMIKAVDAYRKSEAEREAERRRAEYERRLEEKYARLKVGALAQARIVAPGLTEDDFSQLEDIFREYLHELEDW